MVGIIVGCVFLVVIFRCLVALHRMNDVRVITVEDDTQHTRTVSMSELIDFFLYDLITIHILRYLG